MTDELPYRVAVLVVIATATSIVVRARRAAALPGSPAAGAADAGAPAAGAPDAGGPDDCRAAPSLRLAGASLALSAAGYVLLPTPAAPLHSDWGASGRACGAAAAALGAWLLRASLRELGPNLTASSAVRSGATLVVTGPYRWVRHPYYVAAALLIAGTTLLSGSTLIATTGGLVAALLVRRLPEEEAALVARFGDAYAAYRARTGCFVPRVCRARRDRRSA